jgi:hypothetical protein
MNKNKLFLTNLKSSNNQSKSFSFIHKKMDVEYSVSKRGVVTYKETGNPIPSKIIENTDEFETINQFVVEHIQKKLTKKLGLKKVLVPFQSSDENRTYILMSTDFTSNTEKLLVFVPTKGEISPGQCLLKKMNNLNRVRTRN